ncbi:N-acetylmuramoyl-L-alanine amidase [Rhizobium sp. RU20A]|uniref:N-acetylmuramoyl-L-alanine amidase n=1 Tax=Rhizobium sp. RU20A TaxID=1907412 RepID=UPI0009562DEF|nr:N-acetylmuramoyl-L-alanine amidase [Rhizobium sp. RU20A]SIP98910.1 N-acetylmuramoyl-L-alanine amidase [Rhizobium sp. RU20A]
MTAVIRRPFIHMIALASVLLVSSGAALAPTTDASVAAASPLLAYEARLAGDDARGRLVISFDRRPDFAIHYLANPWRVVIDLPETAFGIKPEDMTARGLFREVRYGAMGGGAARIVLTATRPVQVTLADVQPEAGDKGYRLVVDTAMITEKEFTGLLSRQTWTASVSPRAADASDRPAAVDDGKFVIAIDPGHGGIDAGASGATTNTPEKDVTLAFARELAGILGKQDGVRVILTRDKDEFLSLSQRVQLARNGGAKLFISLHADTLKQKDIRGATVYTISDKASDHLAASLAERENLSDEIAGVPLDDGPAEVADILIDLTRRETQVFSVNLARSVVSSFEGQIALINNPHRHAGFRVLQAPDVPSVLLELGFLSNPEDEKQLLDPAWRRKVAERIAAAVSQYRATVVANGG